MGARGQEVAVPAGAAARKGTPVGGEAPGTAICGGLDSWAPFPDVSRGRRAGLGTAGVRDE